MEPREVSTGNLESIELRVLGSDQLPAVDSEAALRWSRTTQRHLLVTNHDFLEVEPDSPRSEPLLARLAERATHLAWVANADEDTGTITVATRTLASSVSNDVPIEVRIGDRLLEDISTAAQVPIPEVIDWLTDEFVLGPPPTGTGEILASGRIIASAWGTSNTWTAVRLFGRSAALDIRSRRGVTEATRFVRNPGAPDAALALLTTPIRFIDAGTAAEFESTGRSELEAIVRDSNGYLAMWDRYNEIEAGNVQRALLRIGSARVRRIEARDDGLDVYVSDAPDGFLDRMAELDVMVELADRVPDLFSGAIEGAGLLDAPEDERSVTGTVAGVDRQRSRIHIQLGGDQDLDTLPISTEGYLFPSVRGDRTRLQRRQAARRRIASGVSAIPHLGLVLEGSAGGGTGRQRKVRLSPAARACFHGTPTAAQKQALEVALAAPDVAIIQGPPGTGKTQVIAALQVLLSEREGDVAASQRILLTSYQHDAVEHAVSRTLVFGIPPARLTSRQRSGSGDPTEAWREKQVDILEQQLAAVDTDELALLREAQRWLRVYQLDHAGVEETAGLLETVLDLAGPSLSVNTAAELDGAARSARERSSRSSLSENHLALRLVRALPTTVEGLADDGSWRIQKAISRLGPLEVLRPGEVERLEELSVQPPTEAALRELMDIRDGLIDRLAAPTELQEVATVDPTVVALLTRVLGEIEQAIVRSTAGTTLAVERFLDDLRHDPAGVRSAIHGYTAVFASTVQQAVGTRMLAAKGAATADELRFETVIVDEAARANPLDLMIPMSLAERSIVLVGDHRQLPHVLEPDVEREVNESVDDQMTRALSTSLFERLLQQFKVDEARSGIQRVVTLDTQFRMHPVLGDLVSEVFYAEDGGLRSGRPAEDFDHDLARFGASPAAWVSVPNEAGAEQRGASKSRRVEAAAIAEELLGCLAERPDLSYGVITFYRAQERAIWRSLMERGAAREREGGGWQLQVGGDSPLPLGVPGLSERVRIGTVDSFQGMEFDVVLLSVTRSNDHSGADPRARYGFLTLANRLCVAMSRQKRLLVACGDDAMFRGEAARQAVPGLAALLQLCEDNGAVVRR